MLRCGVGVCKSEADYSCTNFDPKKMFNKKTRVVYRCKLHMCDKCKKLTPKEKKNE